MGARSSIDALELLTIGAVKTWMHPEIVSIGRLPARAALYPFQDETSAPAGTRDTSSFVRSLNGAWRFTLVEAPEVIPADSPYTVFNDPD